MILTNSSNSQDNQGSSEGGQEFAVNTVPVPPSAERIQVEFDRINEALNSPALSHDQYAMLIAARYAIDWMLGRCRAAPVDELKHGFVARQVDERRAKIQGMAAQA